VAIFEIGTHVSYKGRLYVVVGFTPIGVTPRLLELEDVQSGRTREVEPSDPDLAVEPLDRAHRDENDTLL
jgi:hypothetical protein